MKVNRKPNVNAIYSNIFHVLPWFNKFFLRNNDVHDDSLRIFTCSQTLTQNKTQMNLEIFLLNSLKKKLQNNIMNIYSISIQVEQSSTVQRAPVAFCCLAKVRYRNFTINCKDNKSIYCCLRNTRIFYNIFSKEFNITEDWNDGWADENGNYVLDIQWKCLLGLSIVIWLVVAMVTGTIMHTV